MGKQVFIISAFNIMYLKILYYFCMVFFLFEFYELKNHQKNIKWNIKLAIDPTWIRTWNLLIRSETPYPLGHEAR